MKHLKFLALAVTLVSTQAFAGPKFDRKDTIDGIQVFTHKDDSQRSYRGHVTKTFDSNLKTIEQNVTNFNEKCNQSFAEKRSFLKKDFSCRFHNANIVESFIVKDIKPNYTPEKNEIERYIVGRVIYNRKVFQHYEIVKVYEYKNDKGQQVKKIVTEMINDKEVKKYITPALKRESAFNATISTFTLTALDKNKTQLDYEYVAETDHWLLNKEISVPQVFSSMSKSINDFLETVVIEKEKDTTLLSSN